MRTLSINPKPILYTLLPARILDKTRALCPAQMAWNASLVRRARMYNATTKQQNRSENCSVCAPNTPNAITTSPQHTRTRNLNTQHTFTHAHTQGTNNTRARTPAEILWYAEWRNGGGVLVLVERCWCSSRPVHRVATVVAHIFIRMYSFAVEMRARRRRDDARRRGTSTDGKSVSVWNFRSGDPTLWVTMMPQRHRRRLRR